MEEHDIRDIDWNSATRFPAILTKNNTNTAGGRKLQFDTPEIADKIVASLCGSENKVNYLIAVLPLNAIEAKPRQKPGPKPKQSDEE